MTGAAPVVHLASVPAERDVPVVSGLAPIFVERALVAAPVVFVVALPVFDLASVLAERDVAVVSGLDLIVVLRDPVAFAVFVLAPFRAGRVFVPFALPAVVAARSPAGSCPLMTAR